MSFCLPKEFSDKFLEALKGGFIKPENLMEMSSEERRAFLEPIVGKEDVHEVNALLESKLLLQDQKRGMVSWAKKVANISEARRADLLSRIEKLDHVLEPDDRRTFLEDLVAKRLGTEVTVEEARTIADLSKKLVEARSAWDGEKWTSEEAKATYGATKVALNNYVSELKLENEKATFKNTVDDLKQDPVSGLQKVIGRIAGFSKGIAASLDDSAIFRQGWRTVFTHPAEWMRNTLQTFRDIPSQLKEKPTNKDIVNGALAEIHTRDNAMNGNYTKLGIDIGNLEEAFPSSLPEKIPLFGRLYAASETAYTTFLYRMRADIADKYLKIAENNGFDLNDKEQMKSLGKLINALTGRGDLGAFEKVGKNINSIFFSPKNVASQFQFLTSHLTDKTIRTSPFLRKQAAINLAKVVAGTAVIMGTAQAIFGKDAVETDSRSSDFGKIRIGDTRFDITGGMGSIAVLASRLLTDKTKNTTTKRLSSLSSGKFGAPTKFDVLIDFAAGKASPLAGVAVDYMKGSTFGGGKPTPLGESLKLVTPLPISNAQEILTSPNGANPLLTIIADSLGISTNTYTPGKKN